MALQTKKDMDMKIPQTISIPLFNSAILGTSMRSETASKSFPHFAPAARRLMSTGTLLWKIQNGFLIFVSFWQQLGKLHTGFMFGECLYFCTVATAGTELPKFRRWLNSCLIRIIEPVMDFQYLWKKTL